LLFFGVVFAVLAPLPVGVLSIDALMRFDWRLAGVAAAGVADEDNWRLCDLGGGVFVVVDLGVVVVDGRLFGRAMVWAATGLELDELG
jgi:hypothetical protein